MIRKSITALLIILVTAVYAGEQAPGQISIETDPANAYVWFDGSSAGQSPALVSKVTQGEHLIIAEKAGYRTARLLVTARNAQRIPVRIKLEKLNALALIQTDPADAEVTIDGISRGKTPVLLSDLQPGKYRVKLEAQGFQPKEVELNAVDRTPVKLSVSLNSDSAKLTVNSRPPGASVLLNGVERGITPLVLDRIPAGIVSLEVSMQGCAPFKQMLNLSAGQNETVTAALDQMPARLKVVSIPDKARIYIDNQYKGESPLDVEGLAPGSYRLRAELRGYEILSRNISLDRAQNSTEEFRLTRNAGALEITTEPAAVRILVDGEELGITEKQSDGTDKVSKPLTLDAIGLGPHKLQLLRAGYFTRDIEVNIEKDRTTAIHEKLKRMFIRNYTIRTSDSVYEGMLLEHTLTGGIVMEIRPGIIKNFSAGDIVSHAPLRTAEDQPAKP